MEYHKWRWAKGFMEPHLFMPQTAIIIFYEKQKKIAHKRTIFCISRRIYAEFRGEYMITVGCSWFTYFICIYWLPLFVFVGLMPNWMANISTIHITNNAHRSFTHSTDTKLPRAMRRVRNQATYILYI